MTSPLAFKPWTRPSQDSTALKDVLARANLERGHFRTITESSLQEEIAGEGAMELSDESEDSDEDDDEDEDEEAAAGEAKAKPTNREELYKAKGEMLKHLDAAHNDVMLALDFVSLLLSKEAPGQAQQTVSPMLKHNVPLGTLGTDIWLQMPVDTAREAQEDVMATNVRMEGLQQSADSLLSAASRLEDNVRKEAQYWDQILSITEKGWNVCKIPGQQHRLGVTFGFSESAPQFSRRGIAALNASEDGGIALERGVGSKPKALRALLKRGEEVVGGSKVPSLPDEGEATLEARIRHARDSLFDEELFHEMVRESRDQASLGVSMKGEAICFAPEQGEAVEVQLELVSFDDVDSVSDESHPQDAFAQAIVLAARMLLGQAHREKLKKRSQVPPPMSERKEERPTLPILRPIMAFVLHHAAIQEVNTYMETVETLFAAAKIGHRCSPAKFELQDGPDIATAELLMSTLMRPWLSRATASLDGEVETDPLTVTLITTLDGNFGTMYHLDAPDNPQSFSCSSFEELHSAVDAALASRLAGLLLPTVGEGWTYDRREALLTKGGDEGEKGGRVWITVDGEEGCLAMNSPTKKMAWRRSGESSEKAFEEAWRDVVG